MQGKDGQVLSKRSARFNNEPIELVKIVRMPILIFRINMIMKEKYPLIMEM